MLPGRNGAFHLFRVFGINVYVHWTWFIAAAVLVHWRPSGMSAAGELIDLLAIFGIVLAHEFGHALACRSVGGVANQIVLWPLGGVAYVRPPVRPGAALWSIVAGPLVNVVLVGVLTGLYVLVEGGVHEPATRAGRLLEFLWAANLGLLIFNMLPIYPLDGGQTLQAVLWFFLGLVRQPAGGGDGGDDRGGIGGGGDGGLDRSGTEGRGIAPDALADRRVRCAAVVGGFQDSADAGGGGGGGDARRRLMSGVSVKAQGYVAGSR